MGSELLHQDCVQSLNLGQMWTLRSFFGKELVISHKETRQLTASSQNAQLSSQGHILPEHPLASDWVH